MTFMPTLCGKKCGVFLQYTLFNFVVGIEDLRSVTIVSHVAEVTFVSHEWSGLQHPDPKILGQKNECLEELPLLFF